MELLLALIIIIGLGYLLGTICERRWNKGLKVKVTFDKAEAAIGEEVEIKEVVMNASRMFLPYIYLKYDVDRNGAEYQGRNGVFSLLYRQKVTRHIVFPCEERGCYDIENTYLVFKGLFLKSTLEHRVAQHSRLIVYPKIVDVSDVPINYYVFEGEKVHNPRVFEDRLAFRDIREYVDTDDMSRINWNATAITNKLMVNTYEDMRRAAVRIVMELPDRYYERADELTEKNISIAVSLYLRLLEQKIPVSFVSNGLDCYTKRPVCLPERSDIGYEKEVLESFARIAEVDTLEISAVEALHMQTTVVLISQIGDMGKSLKSQVFELADRGYKVLWIVVASECDTEAIEQAERKVETYGVKGYVDIFEWK